MDLPPTLPPQACIEFQIVREAGPWRVGDRVRLANGSAGEIRAFRCDGNLRPSALILLDGPGYTAVWPLVELARP